MSTIARSGGELVADHVGRVSTGMQLHVAGADTAVVTRNGEPLRVLPAGTYTVPAEFAGEGVRVRFVSNAPQRLRFGGATHRGPVFGEVEYVVEHPDHFVGQMRGMAIADIERQLQAKVMEGMKKTLLEQPEGADLNQALLLALLPLRNGLGVQFRRVLSMNV